MEIIIPETITEEKARQMYTSICGEYMTTHEADSVPDSALQMILDMCTMEQIKGKLLEEIARKPVTRVRNGRQEYEKPNAAIAEVNKIISSQRRILAELRLTPASRKGVMGTPMNDEFADY